jgi:putative ABC transport system permease protein
MNFFESLEIALKSLWVNKMRTLLTMLGIIIGISSVIAVVAIGDGSKNAITNEFENIGMNRIILMTNWQEDIYSNDQLTYRDFEMINRTLDDQIKASSVDMFFSGSVLDYGDQKKEIDVSIEAVSDEYNNIENITIDEGRFLNRQDLNSRNNNVVTKKIWRLNDLVGPTCLGNVFLSPCEIMNKPLPLLVL